MFLKTSLKIITSYFIVHAEGYSARSCSSGGDELLIKNGKVVNWNETQKVDVLIKNGRIKEIGKNLKVLSSTKTINANNMYVIPGGIDPHTHFNMEFMGTRSVDDFCCGTRAAVAGGTTTIIDFAICKQQQSPIEAYQEYRKMADGKVCCDYGLHIGLSSWSEEVSCDMEKLVKEHGINSFKVFMAYKDVFMLNDCEILDVMTKCKCLGAICMVHAENGCIIAKNIEKVKQDGIIEPHGHQLSHTIEAEAEAVNRAAILAKQTDCPLYVVHIMSKEAGCIIAERRKKGQCRLYGETLCSAIGKTFPQACAYDIQAGHIMSPALRSEEYHSDALINFLKNNVIQTTGSDNCTFTKEQKRLGKQDFTKIPNGVNGVEDRMAIIWEKAVHSGKIDVQKFVQVTSTNAAKLFNLFPQKGCIAVDSDADIVIWNPKKERTISAKTHHHSHDFNIFEGITVHGGPEIVLVRGKILFEDNEIKDAKGYGKYLPRKPFAEEVYCIEYDEKCRAKKQQ